VAVIVEVTVLCECCSDFEEMLLLSLTETEPLCEFRFVVLLLGIVLISFQSTVSEIVAGGGQFAEIC